MAGVDQLRTAYGPLDRGRGSTQDFAIQT